MKKNKEVMKLSVFLLLLWSFAAYCMDINYISNQDSEKYQIINEHFANLQQLSEAYNRFGTYFVGVFQTASNLAKIRINSKKMPSQLLFHFTKWESNINNIVKEFYAPATFYVQMMLNKYGTHFDTEFVNLLENGCDASIAWQKVGKSFSKKLKQEMIAYKMRSVKITLNKLLI